MNKHEHEHEHQHEEKKDNRECRMIAMFVIHVAYMLSELIAGIIGHSLTLTGDSFHMLSDALAMTVGFLSIKLGKKKSDHKQTFGYKRLETLGAFFNASFLLSTAFFLITEVIQKFISPELPTEIDVVLYVAIGGMIITGHEGHDHSHGHSHSHSHDHEHEHEEHDHDHECPDEHHHCEDSHDSHDHHEHEMKETVQTVEQTPEKKDKKNKKDKKQKKEKKHHDMALRGVFLHVVGDFLGSVVAIAAALVVKFAPDNAFAPYADPTGSCIMIIILIRASIPLLKDSMKILLLESNLDCEKIQKEIESIENVKVHDLHIWEYTQDQFVAHCHVEIIKCKDTFTVEEYNQILANIQDIFHQNQIHKTAVEAELLTENDLSMSRCYQQNHCNQQKQWK